MRKKKSMILVVVIVVVALVVSIVSYLISDIGKSSNKSIAQKVDKNNIIQKSNSSKSSADTKSAGTKGTSTKGTAGTKDEVVLKSTASKEDTSKLINDYLNKVVTDSNDKRTEVSFKQNNKEVEKGVVYKDLQSPGSNIKYSLRIQNGFLPMNRFIEVILQGDSSGHTVSISNANLKYSSEKKVYYGVVNLTDENKIKDSIKIK